MTHYAKRCFAGISAGFGSFLAMIGGAMAENYTLATNTSKAIEDTLPDIVSLGLILGLLAAYGLIGFNMRRN